MSVSPSLLSFPAVTSRLRAAGCVFAEDEARLLLSTARSAGDLETMLARRTDGLPLEQVLGWAEFCGLRIAVDPGVFVPRRRTEFLVRRAAELAPPEAVVLDLCCGTGALGAALAAAVDGRTELHAADVDPAAVRCARGNVAAAGGRVYRSDLYTALPASLRGRVNLLPANVPYVPTSQISLLPAEARLHEPCVALDGGSDGLDVLRRVVAGAASWLAPGGHLLFETGDHQVPTAVDVVTGAGLTPEVTVSEELFATVVTATKPYAGSKPAGAPASATDMMGRPEKPGASGRRQAAWSASKHSSASRSSRSGWSSHPGPT